MFNANSLPGNPHFEIAASRLGEAPKPEARLDSQLHFGADANAQATLALAFEVRTVALMLLYTQTGQPHLGLDGWGKLGQNISDRLGDFLG